MLTSFSKALCSTMKSGRLPYKSSVTELKKKKKKSTNLHVCLWRKDTLSITAPSRPVCCLTPRTHTHEFDQATENVTIYLSVPSEQFDETKVAIDLILRGPAV